MNGNRTEAEDALSGAKLKAWEKMQKLAQKIVKLYHFRLHRNDVDC